MHLVLSCAVPCCEEVNLLLAHGQVYPVLCCEEVSLAQSTWCCEDMSLFLAHGQDQLVLCCVL